METSAPNQPNPFYLENAERILAEVTPFFERIERLSAGETGGEFPVRSNPQTVTRFNFMLLELPYIGGQENSLTSNLVMAAAMLCVYQEQSEQGKSLEEIGKLIYDAVLETLPEPGPTPDSRQIEALARAHQQAEAFSSAHPYEYGWNTRYLEGDGEDFVWGVDYTSCGVCRLFEEYSAEAFIPYVCFLDLPMYKARGVGLVRTQTLAQGHGKCDFRFNLRGEYGLEWYPGFYQE